MHQETVRVLFALIRSAILDKKMTEEELCGYSQKQLPELLEISAKHDIAHLVVIGLRKNNLITKEDAILENCIFKAVYRYEKLKYEYSKLCDILEKERIAFIPLKGSVIRKYYKEEWMRTSCDIDILVHESDLNKAADILVNKLGYIYNKKGAHDISLFTSGKTHVELHYNLIENNVANKSAEVLKNIWDMTKVKEGFNFFYEMRDEALWLYLIAHTAKHFELGGCGIRAVIDFWLLDNIDTAAWFERKKLLKDANLLKFADSIRRLSKIWFGGFEYDEASKWMEEYIIRGGAYGDNRNRIDIQQQKRGGRLKYAFSKIFIPYNTIKFHYPVLQKYPYLTPFMQVRRWFKLLFCGHLKRVFNELKYNHNISEEKATETRRLLESIGL